MFGRSNQLTEILEVRRTSDTTNDGVLRCYVAAAQRPDQELVLSPPGDIW